MNRRPSWLNLRAVSDGPRTIRVRGSEIREAFVEPSASEAARILLPLLRESLEEGEHLCLEISFGPMVDEVMLSATVEAIDGDRVALSVPLSERSKTTYVLQVLAGTRSAAARRHRRVPVDLEVRWTWKGDRYASRARDLSYGGAFIESRVLPSVGARVDVVLRTPDAAGEISVGGEVAWLRQSRGTAGFGVCFKLPDRSVAARLHEVVRECECAFVG
ncbi:MAG: PilZ domain-containing protein [Nannocystaceae bacterium]|nr:PilZ domain-containing protein [bacterium]